MRRKDREVRDYAEVFDILRRCDTIRIGMCGDGAPYVVPVSFGVEKVDGKAVVYFHCAQAGMKIDVLRLNPKVCVEGDIFIRIEPTKQGGITARYESVIGFGVCEFVSEADEVLHGLRVLCDHYGYGDFPLDSCKGLQHLLVGKITLDSLTGKRNLPEEENDNRN